MAFFNGLYGIKWEASWLDYKNNLLFQGMKQ